MSMKEKKLKEQQDRLERLWDHLCRAEEREREADKELRAATSSVASIKRDIKETEEWIEALSE